MTIEIGKLGAFIINIQTLETIIPAEHRALAINCIRGKLEGTAAALIPSDATSAPSQHGLVNNIKAEPSTVVEARLSAIRFDNHNLTKFSEEVEKVASLLSQTLISEGIPIPKANEMTIARVVETCRKSARNDLVKSVLASSRFDTPKAVLSKFVTEVADQNKDKQFLAYESQRYNNRGQFQRGSHNNSRGSYNRGRGSYNRGGRGSFNNFNNNYRDGGQYNGRGGNHYNSRGGAGNNRPNHVRLIQEGESGNEVEARWPMQ